MTTNIEQNAITMQDVEEGKAKEPEHTSNDAPYSIYTKRQKIAIVLTASTAGFISPMTAAIYMPALNSIAAELNVSNTLINLTLTGYLIFQGLAPAFIGGYSDAAGRRPAYMISIIIWVAANIGIALQTNYAALFLLRCLQSSGSSSLIALANAIVADIAPSAERGTYVAYASVGSVLGPSLGPLLGGILSELSGWRWIFWFLTIFGCTLFVPIFLFFPETCREIVGNGSIPPPALNHTLPTYLYERRLKREGRHAVFEERDRLAASRHLTFPSPVATVKIIFTKVAGLTLLGTGILFCCYYAIVSSVPSQFRQHYGYNDLQISLIYLPFGVGSLLSAFSTGRIIDWNFRRHAHKLGVSVIKNRQTDLSDFPIERARMEIAIPLVLIGAVAMLVYGWLVALHVSVAGPCVFIFIVGYSISAGFNCMNILLVDMYSDKPATATAANNLVRCWMGAGAAAGIIPLIDAIGYGPAVSIAAGIWVAFTPMLGVLGKSGPKWRREAATRQRLKREAAMAGEEEKAEDKAGEPEAGPRKGDHQADGVNEGRNISEKAEEFEPSMVCQKELR